MYSSSVTKFLLVALPVLVLVPRTAVASDRSSSKNRCVAVVRTVDQAGNYGSRQRYRDMRVSAYETSRIELRAYCTTETTASALKIEVILPNGDLYETLELVAVESSLRRGRRRRWHRVASAELPVAGTLVTQYQLFGKWSAKVCRADGAAKLCGRATRFTVED